MKIVKLFEQDVEVLTIEDIVKATPYADGIRVVMTKENYSLLLIELTDKDIPSRIVDCGVYNVVVSFPTITSYKEYADVFEFIKEVEDNPEF